MGEPKKDEGQGSSNPVEDDGERSWARVVQGTSRGPSWTSHAITEDDIERLQSYFIKVLELPVSMIDEARH